MSGVQVPQIDVAFCFQSWLEEEGDDQNEADQDRTRQRLQSRPVGIDKLPSDHVVKRRVRRFEPVGASTGSKSLEGELELKKNIKKMGAKLKKFIIYANF